MVSGAFGGLGRGMAAIGQQMMVNDAQSEHDRAMAERENNLAELRYAREKALKDEERDEKLDLPSEKFRDENGNIITTRQAKEQLAINQKAEPLLAKREQAAGDAETQAIHSTKLGTGLLGRVQRDEAEEQVLDEINKARKGSLTEDEVAIVSGSKKLQSVDDLDEARKVQARMAEKQAELAVRIDLKEKELKSEEKRAAETNQTRKEIADERNATTRETRAMMLNRGGSKGGGGGAPRDSSMTENQRQDAADRVESRLEKKIQNGAATVEDYLRSNEQLKKLGVEEMPVPKSLQKEYAKRVNDISTAPNAFGGMLGTFGERSASGGPTVQAAATLRNQPKTGNKPNRMVYDAKTGTFR